MRIEVLVGSEEPLIFHLNSPKFSLGSGENCDVILSSSGISRKHVVITSEDDKYFVTDQGSTNGSFINEERLIPGKKVEFTSFFPVRLGDNVLVSLLSDEEDVGEPSSIEVKRDRSSPKIDLPERSDATTVINLKDLKKVKTETLVLERNQKREIRKKSSQTRKDPVKVKKKPNYVGWLAVMILAVAGYYNIFVLSKDKVKENVREVGKIITASPEDFKNKPVDPVKDNLVDEADLPTKEFLTNLLDNPKCIIDAEVATCRMFPGLMNGQFGTVQIGLAVYVLIDGTRFFEEAQKFVADKEDHKLVKKSAAFLFFSRHVPEMYLPALGGKRLIVAFFKQTETGPVADIVVAVKPEVWNKNKPIFSQDKLRSIRSIGINAISYAENFYTVY